MTATTKIILREFKRIKERRTLYLLTIIIPLIVFVLYALIYKQALLRELPIAIYDADHSPISQKIIEMVESTPSMKIVKYDNSLDEIKNDFFDGRIQGAIYFPRNMEKDLKEGKKSSVVVYKNTSNLIIGNTILKDATTIVRTLSAGVLLKKIRSKGMTYDRAMNIVNPIRIETNPLYNSNYSYLNYMVPGVIGFTFQMLIMIASVIVISSEFSHNTFGELVELAERNVCRIILGKFTPHFLINLSTALMIIGIVFPLFGIPVYGSIILLLLLFVFFIAANLMMGLAISSFFHDQLFATELAVFINTPAFIISGFTFPLWAMPTAMQLFSQVMPFTHFLSGFLKIYQMNASFNYVIPDFISISYFVFASLFCMWLALRHHVKVYVANPGGTL
jgi:ABC-2 type transport system permease protein